MRSDAQNLEAIVRAINEHNIQCGFPATAVAMSPFEKERLGWDEIRGLPIVPDDKLGTGVFRVLCDKERSPAEEEERVEAVGRELVAA